MQQENYRMTWAEIDLDAVENNIRQIKKILPKTTRLIAVVKANGYGHGAFPVAKIAKQAGVEAFAVAMLEEALALRKAGINEPIVVLSWIPPEHALIAARYNITLTVFQKEWLEALEMDGLKGPLSIHLKLDTGMGRIGIHTEEELKAILQTIQQMNHVRLTGVFTHFATADEADMGFFETQRERFKKMLSIIRKHSTTNPLQIHIGNSAASIRRPNEMYDFIRLGIAMYGLYPSQIVQKQTNIRLEEAFSLHSRLIHVKKIKKGDSVSYGREFVAQKDEWIGTIPIGYGDGWIRRLTGSEVLINGKKLPIIGRICMDQTMIRLDQPYDVGTKVTLIGKQENNFISIDEIAEHLNTINYEVPCMINHRVPRVYKSKQNSIDI